MLDIGLMQCINGMSEQSFTLEELETLQLEELIYDQFIGQELLFESEADIFYWSSSVDSASFVNYLIVQGAYAFPVGIKGEKQIYNRAPLELCLETYSECKGAFILSPFQHQAEKKDKIQYEPLYRAANLNRRTA
jgi:hypothetical protein